MNETRTKYRGDILRVAGLRVVFSRWGQIVTAVDAVDLAVPRGQWLTIIGHNGSGKSTLLDAIGGVVRADAGRVLLLGKDVGAMNGRELANTVFQVHQDPSLGTAPALTVLENLLAADEQARAERAPKHLLALKYKELLQPLGLDGRLKQPVVTLSGGERQLLALLIARLRPAALVLLDEPLAALDPAMAEACTRELHVLHRQGRTLVVVTHDKEWARRNGERLLVMRGGKIVCDESARVRAGEKGAIAKIALKHTLV